MKLINDNTMWLSVAMKSMYYYPLPNVLEQICSALQVVGSHIKCWEPGGQPPKYKKRKNNQGDTTNQVECLYVMGDETWVKGNKRRIGNWQEIAE
eukprot:scaffold284382_cov75-Attheya_sp.AAC.2